MKLIIHLHGSDKRKAHATLSRNWYQKTCTGFLQVSCNSIPIFFWYQNLVRVRALLYSMSIKETGTGFPLPVFGSSFWIMCHGPYVVRPTAYWTQHSGRSNLVAASVGFVWKSIATRYYIC